MAKKHPFADCKECLWKDGIVTPCWPHSLVSLSEEDLAVCRRLTDEEMRAAIDQGRRDAQAFWDMEHPGNMRPPRRG